MSPVRARAVEILAAVALFGAAAAGPAVGAVAATVPHHANLPATSKVPCSSISVWLKLFGSSGENCYTGNGTKLVDLPGVREEQIVGRHEVCLRTSSGVRCALGPGTFFFLPVTVTEITISTP